MNFEMENSCPDFQPEGLSDVADGRSEAQTTGKECQRGPDPGGVLPFF